MTLMTNTMRRLGLPALMLLLGLAGIGRAEAQDVVYYHTDALGTPVVMTDSSGNVISGSRREFEPYGRQLAPTPVTDGPGYTGHVSDAATGLSYMQQRYMDPEVGRFLSTDPINVDGTTAWNFCRYCYAGDNPYTFTDPDGRQQFPRTFVMPQGFPVNAKDGPAYERSKTAPGATRQQLARGLDRVSVGATTVALATSADVPPVAVVAEGLAELAALGAVATEYSHERLLSALTGNVLKIAKEVSAGTEAAETTVRAVEVTVNGHDITVLVNDAQTEDQSQTPPPPPPPPPKKQDDPTNEQI